MESRPNKIYLLTLTLISITFGIFSPLLHYTVQYLEENIVLYMYLTTVKLLYY